MPDALPEIFSPESVAWSMAIPPADEKLPAASRSSGPSPALRVWLVSAALSCALKRMSGLAGGPVTCAVPLRAPAASRPGEKSLARAAGSAENSAARSSVWPPAVPETPTEPPPTSSASFSMVAAPLAMDRLDGCAIAALMPRMVASPEAISKLVLPSGDFHPACSGGRDAGNGRAAGKVGPVAVALQVDIDAIDDRRSGSDGVGLDRAGDRRGLEIIGDQRVDGDGLRREIAARNGCARRIDRDSGRIAVLRESMVPRTSPASRLPGKRGQRCDVGSIERQRAERQRRCRRARGRRTPWCCPATG